MKIATASSTQVDVEAACAEAWKQLHTQLGCEPNLLFVAWSVEYPGERVINQLKGLAPSSRIHGTSSCSGAMTEAGYISESGRGLTVLGMADPEGGYGVGVAEMGNSPGESAAEALMMALEDADRPGEVPDLIRLSAPPGAEEAIISGLEGIVGEDVPIVGGSSADNTVEGHWLTGTHQQVSPQAIVVSVLFPSVETSFAFHSGYSPTETVGKVTRAEGRLLQEIDGRPAAVVYNEWTDGAIADALEAGGNVLASTTLFPLGRKVGDVGGVPYFQLSHPDGVTAEGALSLFSEIAEGDELVLMQGSVDSLVTRAGRVADAALQAGEMGIDAISGALVVYCAGCMLTVQTEMSRVVDSLNHALGEKPFLGTFTFGEQGCFIGGENRHGNLMISVVLFGQ